MNEIDPSVYGVSYFFMALVVAGIAQGKGRSGLIWWIVALLTTPPFALFILVAFFSNVYPQPNE